MGLSCRFLPAHRLRRHEYLSPDRPVAELFDAGKLHGAVPGLGRASGADPNPGADANPGSDANADAHPAANVSAHTHTGAGFIPHAGGDARCYPGAYARGIDPRTGGGFLGEYAPRLLRQRDRPQAVVSHRSPEVGLPSGRRRQ